MVDVFEQLARGDLRGLQAALAADPALAARKHASGASLLAWAHYAGRPEAADLIRPHLGALDPYDAIIAGDLDTVRQHLDAGWDSNSLAPDGFTPLALSVFLRRPAIFELLLPLTRNLDEAAANPQQVAALHSAVAVRDAGMVEALLRAGADPNRRQAAGFTPLHAAAQHGDAPIAGLLLLFGADPGVRNDNGDTAADQARAAGHDWLAERLVH